MLLLAANQQPQNVSHVKTAPARMNESKMWWRLCKLMSCDDDDDPWRPSSSCSPLQAHDSPVRAMTWSHNDMWMLTADHGGYVKYWQSNMNNVKMFQAHKEAIREARFIPNLPLSVVHPSLCCLLSATRGRCLAPRHMLLLLWVINDRCKCVLLQHCSDLLLMFFLMWLMSFLPVE